MARPKTKTAADELFPAAAPTDAELSAEFEYQEFLETLGDGTVSVTIHRYPKFGNILEWCDNGPVGDATLESIREKHGPGKYKLSFRGPTGMLGTKNVCIAPTYNGKEQPVHGNGNGNGGTGSSNDDFMRQQLLMQQNMMLALLGSMKAPDMGGMMAGIAAVMTAIKPANMEKPIDPIQMFQTVMGLYQGMKDKNEKPALEQLRDVASVIKEFSGDSSKGSEADSMWGMVAEVGKEAVTKLAPVLTSMVPQPLQNPNPAASARPVIPPAQLQSTVAPALPTPGNAVLPGNVPAGDARLNLERWVQSMVAFFKPKAMRGSDPGLWIDYVFESPEDPGCQALTYAIRNGATFEDLLAFDAEIAQNPQLNIWFKTVYDGIRAELLQSPMASTGQVGNEGNPVSDGKPGQAGPSVPPGLPDGTVVPKSA